MAFKKSAFTNPPAEFSPGFFWIWNTRLDEATLRHQLEDMVAHGAKSVCLHPFPRGFRPGSQPSDMTPDYMTKEYLELLSRVFDYATELGMHIWLYDEGGWPSGGACGEVMKNAPKRFARSYYVKGDDGIPVLKHDIPHPELDAPYPNVIEKGVTEKFLKLTHERLKKYVSRHFGKSILSAFSDEPAMPRLDAGRSLGWCSDFAKEFIARKGYDIMPHIAELLEETPANSDVQKVRVDYLDVKAQLFAERYMIPLRDWCRANHLRSGGHLGGEDEPEGNEKYGFGHVLRSLRLFDTPGVDVIWRQLFPGGRTAPFPKYASSAAHQTGAKDVFSESFGIYGNGLTPDEMKWLIDYMLVRGITQFVFGSFSYKTFGQNMVGAGPKFGPNDTYWDFMPPLFSYAARIGSLLSTGKPAIRIAVFYDIKAIWAGGKDERHAVKEHFHFSDALLKGHHDFDFIDDDQLSQASIRRDGTMKIGKMAYSAIVLPTSNWLSDSAKECLRKFKTRGGIVIHRIADIKCLPKTCDISGKDSSRIRVCKRECTGSSVYFLVNETAEKTTVRIGLDETKGIVRGDPSTGKFIGLKTQKGKFGWTFEPYGSLLIMTGTKPDVSSEKKNKGESFTLDGNWMFRKIRQYAVGKTEYIHTIFKNAKPRKVNLGDWRPILGEEFSGRALYSLEFSAYKAGKALLDLGRVCHACEVKLNGESLPLKFFGPHTYEIVLKKGKNLLEVTVANALANAVAPAHIRDGVYKRFPPVSPYDSRTRIFDQDNHESGLYGPVTCTYL